MDSLTLRKTQHPDCEAPCSVDYVVELIRIAERWETVNDDRTVTVDEVQAQSDQSGIASRDARRRPF